MTGRDERPADAALSADSTGSPQAGPEQTLRKRAEEIARKKSAQMPENQELLSPEDARQLLHELRVYQIELEMQNEELRETQAKLETSRARYFDLYQMAPVGYVTLSEQGLILEANLTAATLFDVSRGALIKKPISNFILAGDQDIYYRHRRLLFETNAPQVWELRLLKKNAAPLWVQFEATVAHEGDGTPICRVAMSDITKRRLAEEALGQIHEKLEQLVAERTEALRLAEENFHRSLDESPLGVRIVTIDGETIYANQAMLVIYGYDSMEELKANPVVKRYTRESFAQFQLRREQRKKGDNSPSEYTVSIIRKKGEVRHLQVLRKEILWDGQRQFQVIYQDITDRKRAEASLARERHHLAEANTTLRVLLERMKEDQHAIEKKIMANIRKLVFPHLENLRSLKLNNPQASCLEMAITNLEEITSPLLQNLSAFFANFTRREIQVADMVRGGMTSKEIANRLNMSIRSVEFHRDKIRKKLGLNRKNTNLYTFLTNLPDK